MEITINLDDDLLREATAIHPGKTRTAVLELGLRELIITDRRKTLAAAFGSQPDLQSVPRRRLGSDQPVTNPPPRRRRYGTPVVRPRFAPAATTASRGR